MQRQNEQKSAKKAKKSQMQDSTAANKGNEEEMHGIFKRTLALSNDISKKPSPVAHHDTKLGLGNEEQNPACAFLLSR